MLVRTPSCCFTSWLICGCGVPCSGSRSRSYPSPHRLVGTSHLGFVVLLAAPARMHTRRHCWHACAHRVTTRVHRLSLPAPRKPCSPPHPAPSFWLGSCSLYTPLVFLVALQSIGHSWVAQRMPCSPRRVCTTLQMQASAPICRAHCAGAPALLSSGTNTRAVVPAHLGYCMAVILLLYFYASSVKDSLDTQPLSGGRSVNKGGVHHVPPRAQRATGAGAAFHNVRGLHVQGSSP